MPETRKIGNMVLGVDCITKRFNAADRMNCRDIQDLFEWLDYLESRLNWGRKQIADLTAKLSAMTQERDAHGAQRDGSEKRLMDCQYSLADVTAKLAESHETIETITRTFGAVNDERVAAETVLTEMTADRDHQYERNGEIALLRLNLETAETALREGLKKYGQHLPNCEIYRWGTIGCNCGLTALSAAPQTEAPKAMTLTLPSMDAMPARIQPSTDLREQAISFAYGNVSIHNPAVTREMCVAEYDKLNPPAPEKCPKCGGKGGEFFRDPNDDADWRDCPACHGTGLKVQNG